MVSGITEFFTFSSCQEAVVPCSNSISWNTTSEFINFFFKLLNRFLSGLFDVVVSGRLCIPFDENKMADVEVPFLGFF